MISRLAKTLFWVGVGVVTWLAYGLVLWSLGAPSLPIALVFLLVVVAAIAVAVGIIVGVFYLITKLYEWIDTL